MTMQNDCIVILHLRISTCLLRALCVSVVILL